MMLSLQKAEQELFPIFRQVTSGNGDSMNTRWRRLLIQCSFADISDSAKGSVSIPILSSIVKRGLYVPFQSKRLRLDIH
jgi:hypothetical protein